MLNGISLPAHSFPCVHLDFNAPFAHVRVHLSLKVATQAPLHRCGRPPRLAYVFQAQGSNQWTADLHHLLLFLHPPVPTFPSPHGSSTTRAFWRLWAVTGPLRDQALAPSCKVIEKYWGPPRSGHARPGLCPPSLTCPDLHSPSRPPPPCLHHPAASLWIPEVATCLSQQQSIRSQSMLVSQPLQWAE